MRLDDSLPERMSGLLDEKHLTIFLFHGVIAENDSVVRNYTGKHIEKELFAKSLLAVKKQGTSLSMDEVSSHLRNAEAFPEKAFTITFDDGFENNLSIAAPILDDLKITATIYITTDFISRNTMSWADRLEYMVEQTREISVKLPWNNSLLPLNGCEEKIHVLTALRQYIKNTPDCDVNGIIGELGESMKSEPIETSEHPLDLKMNWRQVSEAADSEYLTFGGHSHTHPILSFLDDANLEFEISTSVQEMHDNAGIHPVHYSYPEGLAHCFNDNVINKLKQFGVKCCPTAISGYNSVDTDPFHLKRIMIINN